MGRRAEGLCDAFGGRVSHDRGDCLTRGGPTTEVSSTDPLERWWRCGECGAVGSVGLAPDGAGEKPSRGLFENQ